MALAEAFPIHAIDRPLLRQQLDDVLHRPLALITAPAGAGKSVLLAQWVSAHPELDFVFLTVDTADDDPIRFSERLLDGLSGIDPGFVDSLPLADMNGGGLGTPLIEAVSRQLQDLEETVIILDDVHRLTNKVLLADLGRLIDALPPNAHLVLSTRTDISIPWGHHRLHQGVTEIRQMDLAFDHSDGEELLERIANRRLGADSVTALLNRTEGWAAGLQLAGITLRSHVDPDEFVTEFSGNDRLIADYLSEEVLHAQTERRRDLLLRMSVLDEMCADLITHLTNETEAQSILEELERTSMFLVPLDNHRTWFRFHHLFRELLRYRLRSEYPRAEVDLLKSAAAWHLDRDQTRPAVEYLLQARDWGAALELICGLGSGIYERREMATVIRWIGQIPAAAYKERREVNLILAALQATEGLAAASKDTVRIILADPRSNPGERACAQAILTGIVQSLDQPALSVAAAEKALSMLAEVKPAEIPFILGLSDPQSLEALATISGGRAHFLNGSIVEARQWLERGLASAGGAYSIWRVNGLGSLALLEAWCGNLARADALVNEAFALALHTGRASHPSTADAHLARALCALERAELDAATLALNEGTLRAEVNRRTQLIWVGRYLQATVHAASGRSQEARRIMRESRSDLAGPPPVVEDRLHALTARLLRLEGESEKAIDLIGSSDVTGSGVAFERVVLALASAETDVARKQLEAASMASGTQAGDRLAQVERLILDAWLADAEGDEALAAATIGDALTRAEDQGLVEVFLRGGPQVLQLVARTPSRSPGFREVVLEQGRKSALSLSDGGLVDPLTDRELEILALMPSRLSNAELGEHCFVSPNTIKTHIAHIYRKLDVSNRNAAVDRARELGLI